MAHSLAQIAEFFHKKITVTSHAETGFSTTSIIAFDDGGE